MSQLIEQYKKLLENNNILKKAILQVRLGAGNDAVVVFAVGLLIDPVLSRVGAREIEQARSFFS